MHPVIPSDPSSAHAAASLTSPHRPQQADNEAERTIQRAAQQAAENREARSVPEGVAEIAYRMRDVRPADRPEEREAYERRREQSERAERVAVCFRGASVPERYRRAALGDRANVPADCATRYAAAADNLAVALSRPGIYAMCGEPGAGKTQMGYGLVNAFCLAGRSAKLVKSRDYVTDHHSTWKSTTAGAERAFERDHTRLSLLVIDEWQLRRGGDDENLTLLRIIDKRYEELKTTVIISNHATREEFERFIDARLADRICDGGGVIICDWPSLRGRIGACAQGPTGERIHPN